MTVRGVSLTSAAIAALVAVAAPAQAQTQTEPTGVWIDHTGRGAVEIAPCGEALCGRVVWLKDAANTQACGVQILGEVKPTGSGVWDKGWIYDPEEDSKFDVELKPVGTDKLRVVGYLGTKLFSETMTWKRAPADLQRCDAKEQTAAVAPAPAPSATPPAPAPSSSATPQAAPPVPPAETPKDQAKTDDVAPKEAPPPAVTKAPEPKPSRQANARPKSCGVELPWFSVKFPCPD